MAALVGISPRRLWYKRNLQMTIQCCRLWKACRRCCTTEAGSAPHNEQTVRRDTVKGVFRVETLHQTFDPCLPCIASFTRSMQRSSSRSVVDTTTQKYETLSNNVKCLMRATHNCLHMLLPHTCVVRHRCNCSGTPQGHHYMISQLVPEGCIRCSCSGTP